MITITILIHNIIYIYIYIYNTRHERALGRPGRRHDAHHQLLEGRNTHTYILVIPHTIYTYTRNNNNNNDNNNDK